MNCQNKTDKKILIIIIGGGPGGITAAIQLKRYGLEPLLLERRELGGLLWNANLVENYPGFPNGVRGEKLVGLMRKQVERLGVEVRREEVEQVDWKENHFTVTTQYATRNTNYASFPSPSITSPSWDGGGVDGLAPAGGVCSPCA